MDLALLLSTANLLTVNMSLENLMIHCQKVSKLLLRELWLTKIRQSHAVTGKTQENVDEASNVLSTTKNPKEKEVIPSMRMKNM